MNNKYRFILGAAAFLLLSSFSSKTPVSGYEIGDKVTDFKLKNVDGKTVSLADNKNAKGFIVVFTSIHCESSTHYENRVIALDSRYGSRGYPVIAINPTDMEKETEDGDGYLNMQQKSSAMGYNFPYLFDSTQAIVKAFGVIRTPTVFVLQKSGSKFIVRYAGLIDNNAEDISSVTEKYVEDAVDALLNGKQMDKTSTNSIGCGIIFEKGQRRQ